MCIQYVKRTSKFEQKKTQTNFKIWKRCEQIFHQTRHEHGRHEVVLKIISH